MPAALGAVEQMCTRLGSASGKGWMGKVCELCVRRGPFVKGPPSICGKQLALKEAWLKSTGVPTVVFQHFDPEVLVEQLRDSASRKTVSPSVEQCSWIGYLHLEL